MAKTKKLVARKATKLTARHMLHGTVAKLRRTPVRSSSLIGTGALLGAAATWLVTRVRRGGAAPQT
jgi:hypothetical protein